MSAKYFSLSENDNPQPIIVTLKKNQSHNLTHSGKIIHTLVYNKYASHIVKNIAQTTGINFSIILSIVRLSDVFLSSSIKNN
jgi:hypothetical protein